MVSINFSAGAKLKAKKIKSLILILTFLFIIFSPFVCYSADNLQNAFGTPLKTTAMDGAGYGDSLTAESFISLIVTTALSFIGLLFLILAIYGGYIWMIARGNEQEVDKAKQIIQNSIIGLVIVIAAYAISWYVINILGTAALQQPK